MTYHKKLCGGPESAVTSTPLSEAGQADSGGVHVCGAKHHRDHEVLMHDVSFDFHKHRMATCSSDQSIKVWDKSESGDWHCTTSWKTHSGSVWHVTWAHPEFGQGLAS